MPSITFVFLLSFVPINVLSRARCLVLPFFAVSTLTLRVVHRHSIGSGLNFRCYLQHHAFPLLPWRKHFPLPWLARLPVYLFSLSSLDNVCCDLPVPGSDLSVCTVSNFSRHQLHGRVVRESLGSKCNEAFLPANYTATFSRPAMFRCTNLRPYGRYPIYLNPLHSTLGFTHSFPTTRNISLSGSVSFLGNTFGGPASHKVCSHPLSGEVCGARNFHHSRHR